MIASVLAAFDNSPATEQFLITRAKLARYELFSTKVLETANAEVKSLFDRVMYSGEFAEEHKLEALAS
jgi:hypothetical protein